MHSNFRIITSSRKKLLELIGNDSHVVELPQYKNRGIQYRNVVYAIKKGKPNDKIN